MNRLKRFFKEYDKTRMHLADETLKRFKHDRRGLAWQLTVAAISVIYMPFVYFPLSMTFDAVYTNITGMYTFTGAMAYAVVFAKLLIDYLLSFFLAFCTYWVLVNAKADPYGGIY